MVQMPDEGGRRVDFGGIVVTFDRVADSENHLAYRPRLRIAAPGVPILTTYGEGQVFAADTTVGVGVLDRASRLPQVIFANAGEGSACCLHLGVATFEGGRWRVLRLQSFGRWSYTRFPHDIDGDGVLDLEMPDRIFTESFGQRNGYPTAIYNLSGARLRNVTLRPGYRVFLEAEIRTRAGDCGRGVTAACAAMAVDGARLGHFQSTWRQVRRLREAHCPAQGPCGQLLGREWDLGDIRGYLREQRLITRSEAAWAAN